MNDDGITPQLPQAAPVDLRALLAPHAIASRRRLALFLTSAAAMFALVHFTAAKDPPPPRWSIEPTVYADMTLMIGTLLVLLVRSRRLAIVREHKAGTAAGLPDLAAETVAAVTAASEISLGLGTAYAAVGCALAFNLGDATTMLPYLFVGALLAAAGRVRAS